MNDEKETALQAEYTLWGKRETEFTAFQAEVAKANSSLELVESLALLAEARKNRAEQDVVLMLNTLLGHYLEEVEAGESKLQAAKTALARLGAACDRLSDRTMEALRAARRAEKEQS